MVNNFYKKKYIVKCVAIDLIEKKLYVAYTFKPQTITPLL